MEKKNKNVKVVSGKAFKTNFIRNLYRKLPVWNATFSLKCYYLFT